MKRSYKTTSLSYKLDAEGLVNGELITTPGLYTGTISVKEASGKYSIDMTGVTFRNYDYAGVQPIGGDVTIIKGIPTIVTYNTKEMLVLQAWLSIRWLGKSRHTGNC